MKACHKAHTRLSTTYEAGPFLGLEGLLAARLRLRLAGSAVLVLGAAAAPLLLDVAAAEPASHSSGTQSLP